MLPPFVHSLESPPAPACSCSSSESTASWRSMTGTFPPILWHIFFTSFDDICCCCKNLCLAGSSLQSSARGTSLTEALLNLQAAESSNPQVTIRSSSATVSAWHLAIVAISSDKSTLDQRLNCVILAPMDCAALKEPPLLSCSWPRQR